MRAEHRICITCRAQIAERIGFILAGKRPDVPAVLRAKLLGRKRGKLIIAHLDCSRASLDNGYRLFIFLIGTEQSKIAGIIMCFFVCILCGIVSRAV